MVINGVISNAKAVKVNRKVCDALYLDFGDAIKRDVHCDALKRDIEVFATGEMADWLEDVEADTPVCIRVMFQAGTHIEYAWDVVDDSPYYATQFPNYRDKRVETGRDLVTGFKLTRVLDTDRQLRK